MNMIFGTLKQFLEDGSQSLSNRLNRNKKIFAAFTKHPTKGPMKLINTN